MFRDSGMWIKIRGLIGGGGFSNQKIRLRTTVYRGQTLGSEYGWN